MSVRPENSFRSTAVARLSEPDDWLLEPRTPGPVARLSESGLWLPEPRLGESGYTGVTNFPGPEQQLMCRSGAAPARAGSLQWTRARLGHCPGPGNARARNSRNGEASGSGIVSRWLFHLGRLLQLAGLVILPVGIVANLSPTNQVSLGTSMAISGSGVLVFYLGWLLQQWSRPR